MEIIQDLLVNSSKPSEILSHLQLANTLINLQYWPHSTPPILFHWAMPTSIWASEQQQRGTHFSRRKKWELGFKVWLNNVTYEHKASYWLAGNVLWKNASLKGKLNILTIMTGTKCSEARVPQGALQIIMLVVVSL